VSTKKLNPFIWNAFEQFGSQAINLILGLIMLKYLTPSDYGFFVIPFLVYNLLKTCQDLGSHELIFRKPDFDSKLLQQVLGFTMIISILIIITSLILPPDFFKLFSTSYKTDKLYINFLVPLLLLTGVSLSYEYYCRKTLKFHLTAVSNLFATLLSGLFGIYFAKNNFGTDSLLYKQIAYVALYIFILLTLTKVKFFPDFKIKIIWKERNFYLPLFTSQILAFSSRNLDNLLIGKYLGIEKLGVYDRAYKFLSIPISQIGNTFHRVVLPILSGNSSDRVKMLNIYLKFLYLISLILFPFLTISAILAEDIVNLIFGSSWVEAIPIIQIFSIAACYQSIGGLNYSIILIDNKTIYFKNLMIFFNILYLIIFLCFTICVPDLNLLVLCYSAATLFFNIYIFRIASKFFHISLFKIFNHISDIIINCFIIVLILLILKNYIQIDSINYLIIIYSIAYTIYIILQFAMNGKKVKETIKYFLESNF
jgi:O-antigen/teichoic acid export membrane protein